jgi:hypothetical protein
MKPRIRQVKKQIIGDKKPSLGRNASSNFYENIPYYLTFFKNTL